MDLSYRSLKSTKLLHHGDTRLNHTFPTFLVQIEIDLTKSYGKGAAVEEFSFSGNSGSVTLCLTRYSIKAFKTVHI